MSKRFHVAFDVVAMDYVLREIEANDHAYKGTDVHFATIEQVAKEIIKRCGDPHADTVYYP